MTFKEELEWLNHLEGKALKIRNRIVLQKAKLSAFCPVDIGDTVEVTGWSFEGKKMVVDNIQYKPTLFAENNDKCFLCTGRIIKKDGSPGQQEGEHRCSPAS